MTDGLKTGLVYVGMFVVCVVLAGICDPGGDPRNYDSDCFRGLRGWECDY